MHIDKRGFILPKMKNCIHIPFWKSTIHVQFIQLNVFRDEEEKKTETVRKKQIIGDKWEMLSILINNDIIPLRTQQKLVKKQKNILRNILYLYC